MRMRMRTAPAAAAVAALAAVTLGPQQAGASTDQGARVLSAASAAQLARSLDTRLEDAGAGSYYDSRARRLVVNVVDPAAVATVRAAGAQARVVRFSQAQLASTQSALDASEEIPGTAWGMDPRVNRVVVTADPTVEGEGLARLEKVVEPLGERVVVRRTDAELTRFIAGGEAIYGTGTGTTGRCTLGFNVTKGGRPHFLTAGHCGGSLKTWAATEGGAEIARTAGSSFPGDDHAVAEYTAPVDHPSAVYLHNGTTQPIEGVGEAGVGQAVRRSGATTGLRSGTVTGLNATVNYREGRVTGLVRTDVCAEAGDSGGPFFAGDRALGLTSGGNGNCRTGGTTYYQPVQEALEAYGASLP
ncbi:S1 family peptidase [Streptomyces stramineus]|uniref:S1 family peptidase n=2 Tax=Streptomyces TaxID=1883 RepID=A0ABN1AF97_9ACTN